MRLPGPPVTPPSSSAPPPPLEITTVADDLVVAHRGAAFVRHEGLRPDTVYEIDGVAVRTLPRPPGELLCRFVTANDVHFGEESCGVIAGIDAGPVLHSDPGEPPYPELMSAAAIEEMRALDPAAVVVKGDLTADGTPAQLDAFRAAYEGVFGERAVAVRGNHEAYGGQTVAAGRVRVDLPGVTLAVLDTAWPRHAGGRIGADQLEWLDDIAASADRPVVVLGHHPVETSVATGEVFGIQPEDSHALVALFSRRPRLVAYLAGHTHRNRVQRFAPTGDVPYAEVACVKDFPGTWAEYRVFEGGILHVHHRIASADALAWSERCRLLYCNVLDYAAYALGALSDRAFVIGPRTG